MERYELSSITSHRGYSKKDRQPVIGQSRNVQLMGHCIGCVSAALVPIKRDNKEAPMAPPHVSLRLSKDDLCRRCPRIGSESGLGFRTFCKLARPY